MVRATCNEGNAAMVERKAKAVAFISVWVGEGLLWFENMYHLYSHAKHTDRDAYYTRKDVASFVKESFCFFDESTATKYYFRLMFEANTEQTKRLIIRYLEGHDVYKVEFNE